MRKLLLLSWGALLCFSLRSVGQVGEKVGMVKLLNMEKDTVDLPFLGEKNLLIFYADPDKPKQNKSFRNYFRKHPVNGKAIASYGIINMAAAPMIPDGLILQKARKETEGTKAELYIDPDKVLSTAWRLPGADRNFTVIFVNRNRVIEFYKAGQLSGAEQKQVMALLQKYGNR